MSIKDDAPDGISYLVLRDTVGGKQPTQWRFWTFSNGIAPTGQTAEAPGNNILGPRQLKGDRFTAPGQFGVDLEYYVASPAATPRHTVRYGLKAAAADVGSYFEYQDMLQLSMPGDGSYYVAMFPRKKSEKAPSFRTSKDGKVIIVRGQWGTDYALMSNEPVSAKGSGFSFQGTAGSIQDRRSGLVLALGAKGTLAAKGYALTAPFGASLRVGEDKLTINLPGNHPAGDIIITAPGNWKLPKQADGSYRLRVPARKTGEPIVVLRLAAKV
jgi:hypothetical protein